MIQACLNSPDHSVIPEYTAPITATTPNNSTIYDTANESAEDDHPRSASTSFAAAIAGLSTGYPQYLPNGSQAPSPATGVSSSSASSISSAAAAAAAAASQVFMNPQSSMGYSSYGQNGGAYWNGNGAGFNASHQGKSNTSVASLQQQQHMYHTMLQQQQLYQQYNNQQQQQHHHPLLGSQHSNNNNDNNEHHNQDELDGHEM